uniref:lipoprotein n=1 Tax=Prevotella sp. TaxID=59823 RepID=UPI002580C10C
MKKYIFLAVSALALASCTSDDFLGNTPGNVQSNTSAINFDGGTGKISRATTQTGVTAAQTLNNNYVVFGYKTANDGSKSTVFDHYTIHWNGLKDKTESNTQGWEYVGQKANSLTSLTGDKAQTIKYWDYSAKQYDFVAFSFGTATQGEGADKVKATAVTPTPELSYTLTGAVKDLANCFIADRITAKPNMETTKKKANLLVGYKDDVQFNFRSLSTKVTMGIYETIPGYSVKDVKFYSSDNTPATDNKPTLYAKGKNIPAGNGTVTVTFPTTTESETDYNKAHVEFAAATESDKSSSIQFGKLSTVDKENEEKGTTGFIGRDITTFSTPKEGNNKKYEVVIPAKVGALTLKVDYTLESIDGSGETIKVTGATAVVPEKYTNWEPNYAYTYIFKISDKTNGSTGGSTAGLYPITFDAIVTETETGKQETITTVADNSITTYAKGAINEEYKKDANIYVSVNNTTDLHIKKGEDDTTPTNVKLFTATGTGSYEKNITEATVALCLSKGTTTATTGEKVLSVDDDNKLTVTPATGLTIATQIEAADAVDGNAISGNFAKFKPTNAGTYVFEFTDTKNKNTKYYKVIIVK